MRPRQHPVELIDAELACAVVAVHRPLPTAPVAVHLDPARALCAHIYAREDPARAAGVTGRGRSSSQSGGSASANFIVFPSTVDLPKVKTWIAKNFGS